MTAEVEAAACGNNPIDLARHWAAESTSLKRKLQKLEDLEADCKHRQESITDLRVRLEDCVAPEKPIRVFETPDGLVQVERYRLQRRKHKAGTPAPADQYGVKIRLLEVEK